MGKQKMKMLKRMSSMMLACVMSAVLLAAPGLQAGAASDNTPSAGRVTTAQGNLNVRSKASSSSSVITTLPKGSYVTLVSKSGAWWYLEYADGKYGYSHGDYLSQVSTNAATVNTSSGNLNVRSGAGTNYPVVGSLSKGKSVVILSESAGWSKVLYQGSKIGYVSSSYLKKGSAAYPSVSLNLPDFKQTDSRWANVKIGNSGKTIAQIGCTTTAIAMMESYRNGKTIYPHEMAKKLSYSSSGDLYWPSDYLNVTNGSGYLNAVYNLLKQGKPVLLGVKNSSGKQHWVVITGYQGGNTLSANQFIIRDPGSNSRTNLQQLLQSYPRFYKYVYYR